MATAKNQDAADELLPEEKYNSAYDVEPKELPPLNDPTNVFEIVSPFQTQDVTDGLRPREGWHQTWKLGKEFREAIDTGYRVIRRSKVNKKEKAGFETGAVLVISDGTGGDLIGMEIPIEYYDRHLTAIASQSHRSYNDPAVVMKGFCDKTGRDLSSKKEQVSLNIDYETQREVLK